MTPTAPYYSEDGITIYCGDCQEIMPEVEADLMVTDPPYGVSYLSGYGAGWERIAGDGDTSARDAALAIWGARPAAVFGTWKAPRPAASRNVLIWDKSDALGRGLVRA